MTADHKIGAIVLAAGGSSRLRRPKQLFEFNGEPLVRHAVETAVRSAGSNVVVVIGSGAAQAREQIADLDVEIVVNGEWQTGISSSIKCGLTTLLKGHPEVGAVIIMLCDQPFVEAGTIHNLIDNYHSSGQPIVACEYDGIRGVPALFSREIFPELLALIGDTGARGVIRKDPDRVSAIDAEEAAPDLDLAGDLDRLAILTHKQKRPP